MFRVLIFVIFFALFLQANCLSQDRLKTMTGYLRYEKVSRELTNSLKLSPVTVAWKDGGKYFEYEKEGKHYRYDIATLSQTEITNAPVKSPLGTGNSEGKRPENRGKDSTPARGRQFTSALSPDGKFKAFYRDHNLWLSDTNGAGEQPITTEGNQKTRVKFGSASWVYGEELYQTTAMWWSTNSHKIAFYRFDESHVPDYYLQLNQTALQSIIDVEPYPKAGGTNPVVDLFIYDLDQKKLTQVDVRDGQPFDNSTIGHYVYGIFWTHDGKELLFHRTNRRQNVMELMAADPDSGKSRVVVRESWSATWTENLPEIRFLKDGKRFIWTSERTGWKNFYLYDLNGQLLSTLTSHLFDVASIVQVDEDGGLFYYLARSGDNPLKTQLHRVSLDGQGERRLTNPSLHHTVNAAPDGKHFIDVVQTHDSPPVTRLIDADGFVLDELNGTDLTKFRKAGFKSVELFTFKAADGHTDLFGLLHRPSNFQPHKRYPLLIGVYAGPETAGARETFALPNALTEFGFLVATLDSRGANGRGKHFMDSIYLNFGNVEIADQAAGVKFLCQRPYVDKKRVGIFGTSYGGTASASCLVQYPEVFHAACSSSPVTDFRNYDTIYTERYMWLPEENGAAYDRASIMTHVKNLKGRLLLYYGTADNNVHPNNSMQLIQALQKAGKSFEAQVGPDLGHGSVNRDRMMEFFIESLGMPCPK